MRYPYRGMSARKRPLSSGSIKRKIQAQSKTDQDAVRPEYDGVISMMIMTVAIVQSLILNLYQ